MAVHPAAPARAAARRRAPSDRASGVVVGRLPAASSLDELAADDAGAARPARCRVDRLSALAVAQRRRRRARDDPGVGRSREPVVLRPRGDGAATVAWGHSSIDVRPLAAGDRGARAHRVSAHLRRQLSVRGRRRRHAAPGAPADWDDDTVHAAPRRLRLGRDATLPLLQVTLGGSAVRMLETVDYAGPGGDAELLGIVLRRRRPAPRAPAARRPRAAALPQQRRSTRARCRATPRPASRHARTVWIGDVLIRAAAVGTETYEINRNLLLTDGAARRLGAQPGDRDRRDRRRRARQRHRALRRRAAVLPAVPRHPGRRRDPPGGARLLRRRASHGIDLPEWESLLQDRIDAELGFEAEQRATATRRRSSERSSRSASSSTCPSPARSASSSTARRSPWSATSTATCTPSATSARTPTSPLSEGEVDGCTIECWLHGSRFDLRTGQPSGPPATDPVPVYPVQVEGDGDDAVVLVDITVNAAAR